MFGVTFPGHRGLRAVAAGASVAILGGIAACGGGGSVSSSPAAVVTTLFSDIQSNNCDGTYAQLSSRLQAQLRGKANVCPLVAQLSQRYRDNKLHVNSVTTHGNQANVRATRTKPNGTSVSTTLSTVVNNDTWKVDSLA
jgi:hypothetical protein